MTILNGSETLYVLGQNPTSTPAAIPFQTTTGAIAALASSGGAGETINTNITTVGAGTLTGAALTGGVINRTGPTAAYSDTTDTAAAIVAAIGSPFIGQSWFVHIKNGTAFAQTILAGSGVTLPASVIVPPNSEGTYLVTLTSLSAVTFVHVATVPLTTIAPTQYAALTNTSGFTLTAATSEAGAADVTINLTGTLGAGANVQSDTAAAIVAAIPNAHAGFSYRLRIINSSSANFAWTLTTNTGMTLTGTMSIAQNTLRDFYVTLTTLTTVTIQAIGTGTQS